MAAHYTEGSHFGYRWYEQHKVKPAFAFGHGLSYTSFSYSDLVVNWDSVTVKVTNTGDRAG